VTARPVVCLDLDRTAIYSAAALDLRIDDRDAPRLQCVEVHHGTPLSYMTEAAAAALITLAQLSTVVPATTRTLAQLARVHLPGPPARYMIASNGGHLLVDGVPDSAWTARVRAALSRCAPVTEVECYLRGHAADYDPAFVRTLRTASKMFVYAVVERAAMPPGWVADLADWCAPRGWTTSVQGRKVYALPVALTKSAAAAEVVARTGGGPLLAAGDSLLDAELLRYADAAIRPAHGELAEVGFQTEHVAVTGATGVAAGEELLYWLLAAIPRVTGQTRTGRCPPPGMPP
jgi:hypothetical protein